MENKRIHGVNDCFSDAIAFMFNIHPQMVPFFVGMKDYYKSTKNFFHKRGYDIRPIPYYEGILTNKNRFYIVQGISPRGNEHCVIYRGTKPYYDPNVKGGFLKKKPHTLWEITKN